MSTIRNAARFWEAFRGELTGGLAAGTGCLADTARLLVSHRVDSGGIPIL